MKILITGATGFIGKHLVKEACAIFGANSIIAFSSQRNHECPCIYYKDSSFDLSEADLKLLENVEVLIHLGAFIPKSMNESNSIVDCNGNIYFTEKLYALPFGALKKVIYISTTDVYESADITTEYTSVRPISLYGLSKYYCEQITAIFASNHHLTYQILRLGHVYGPGEEGYAKFLPKAMKSLLADEPVELWGDGGDIRSLIYIDDVIKAILQSINLSKNLGPINVVGGAPLTIRDLLHKIIEISGNKAVINTKPISGNRRNYIFDNAKMRKYLLPIETDINFGLQMEYAYMRELS